MDLRFDAGQMQCSELETGLWLEADRPWLLPRLSLLMKQLLCHGLMVPQGSLDSETLISDL